MTCLCPSHVSGDPPSPSPLAAVYPELALFCSLEGVTHAFASLAHLILFSVLSQMQHCPTADARHVLMWLLHYIRQPEAGPPPDPTARLVPELTLRLRRRMFNRITYCLLLRCLGQGCIGREGTSAAVQEAVRQAVAGGCQSGWGRLLSVTNAIEAFALCIPLPLGCWECH